MFSENQNISILMLKDSFYSFVMCYEAYTIFHEILAIVWLCTRCPYIGIYLYSSIYLCYFIIYAMFDYIVYKLNLFLYSYKNLYYLFTSYIVFAYRKKWDFIKLYKNNGNVSKNNNNYIIVNLFKLFLHYHINNYLFIISYS